MQEVKFLWTDVDTVVSSLGPVGILEKFGLKIGDKFEVAEIKITPVRNTQSNQIIERAWEIAAVLKRVELDK